jgi:hypothetical protein
MVGVGGVVWHWVGVGRHVQSVGCRHRLIIIGTVLKLSSSPLIYNYSPNPNHDPSS